MKKFGFTLVEVLIALGIIGVITAVAINTIKTITPDQDKIKVLKTYKNILDINGEILNNKELFINADPDATLLFERIRIPSHIKPVPENACHYAEMFATHLHLKGDIEEQGCPTVFTTIDGTQWSFHELNRDLLLITVDFFSDKTSRCTYNSSSCTDPGQFEFRVDGQGHIFPNDPLTAAYLANPDKLNTKKEDYQTAKADMTKYKNK